MRQHPADAAYGAARWQAQEDRFWRDAGRGLGEYAAGNDYAAPILNTPPPVPEPEPVEVIEVITPANTFLRWDRAEIWIRTGYPDHPEVDYALDPKPVPEGEILEPGYFWV